MNDRDFLIWLHERLEHVHGEDRLVDYMHKLREIIHSTDPNVSSWCYGSNSLEQLKKMLDIE